MLNIFELLFRFLRKVVRKSRRFSTNLCSKMLLIGNGVKWGRGCIFNGILIVDVSKKGKCKIGNYCKVNSGKYFNLIGRNQQTYLIVGESASLIIGNNVGMSAVALISYCSIKIGNNVKIGGNTVIYDTDFHSLHKDFRNDKSLDFKNSVSKPVEIEDDVFIGAHVTILKGVRIGKESVIAAGSVVTKNVPSGEIWGGNPARFLKFIR